MKATTPKTGETAKTRFKLLPYLFGYKRIKLVNRGIIKVAHKRSNPSWLTLESVTISTLHITKIDVGLIYVNDIGPVDPCAST